MTNQSQVDVSSADFAQRLKAAEDEIQSLYIKSAQTMAQAEFVDNPVKRYQYVQARNHQFGCIAKKYGVFDHLMSQLKTVIAETENNLNDMRILLGSLDNFQQ